MDSFLNSLRQLGRENQRKAGMQTVTVQRSVLLDKLITNRKEHRDVFLQAQEKFREAVIARLDVMLADARSGKRVPQYVGLEAPTDHTKDYDRVIAMVDMSVSDTIELTAGDFRQYVMDEWSWARQFGNTVSSYGVANKYEVTSGDDE